MSGPCAYKDCQKEGEFPAPRNPRDLSDRQYFCQEHIKEFNKQWNGLNGFSSAEIFNLQHGAATWNRPTWPLGRGESMSKAQFQFKSAEELFGFFRERCAQRAAQERAYDRKKHFENKSMPPDVEEACVIFNIERPVPKNDLKRRYIQLVKKHHPDVNKGDEQADDFIKRINVAYRILDDYLQNNPDAASAA